MARKQRIGFGICGCGSIADVHAESVQSLKSGELVACHNKSCAGAERIAERFGCDPFTDYGAFLRHPNLDVVIVATPSGAHLEPAVQAARAGKHLIVEKPLEVDLNRCDRLIEEARRAKVLLAGIFQSRFTEGIQTLKRALDKNRFGKIAFANASIKWYRSQEYYDSGAWRGTWALDGGGALMNQGIHTLDLLLWLMGPVSEISALCDCRNHRGIEVEDVALAHLLFKNGALGSLQASTAAFPGSPSAIEVFGEKGSAVFQNDRLTHWDMIKPYVADHRIRKSCSTRKKGASGAADPKGIDAQNHTRQIEDFVRALRKGTRPAVDGKEARKAVELVLTIYRAAKRGTTVKAQ